MIHVFSQAERVWTHKHRRRSSPAFPIDARQTHPKEAAGEGEEVIQASRFARKQINMTQFGSGGPVADIITESIRFILTAVILSVLIHRRGIKSFSEISGWSYIVGGCALICFANLIDITDNFPSLNRFVLIGDTRVEAFLEKVVGHLCGFSLLAYGIWKWIPCMIEHEQLSREQLAQAMAEARALRGLLPICAWCKKIRDAEGKWTSMETYIHTHSDARFTHCACPDCARNALGQLEPTLSNPTEKPDPE